ncbi:AraC family transcriptional regulator [Aliidiomarina minuta]|uniref:AraC family transcriptional regulator n=1 Tax=Aliidiomarina minuta TaxID=880057 RepID=A0A432W5R4_9GAMM|nr:helix-turn-helix domain-containing protein [Aliidiomarina minuta]RUO25382.1 AraC family transcriptional regulator [Aliidiomarina minuta]
MSQPSHWPLPAGSSRLLLPQNIIGHLQQHPFSRNLYPIAYGHYLHAVGHRVRRSVHTDHLLIFCHQGRGSYRTEQHQGTIEAGQVLFLRRGVAHSYQSDPDQPWSIYWAHFAGELVGHYMDYIGLHKDSGSPLLSLHNWKALLPDVTQLLNLQHQRLSQERALFASTLLQKILIHLPLLRKEEQQNGAAFNLTTLERFMHDNSHRALELTDFARFTGISTHHFSKKFRQLTGDSPIRYFNHMKIRQAQSMLKETSHSVRQIGQTLGFDDPYYFSRLFKKVTGIAPSAYRQEYADSDKLTGLE